MGLESRSSKYLLLQVWCGLLTVAMVVMAAVLTSITLKTAKKDSVSTSHLGNTSQTAPAVLAQYVSNGSPFSYIQLTMPLEGDSWQNDLAIPIPCDSCSLVLREKSVHCTKSGLYFFYAQVKFSNQHRNQTKSVMLVDISHGKSVNLLVEGIFPATTEGSVWVSKIVHLKDGDSVRFDITDDFLKEGTYWGVYQLH